MCRGLSALLLVVVLGASARAADDGASTLAGLVLERGSRTPIADAVVTCNDASVTTDVRGTFEMKLAPGVRELSIWSAAHERESFRVELIAGARHESTFRLLPLVVPPNQTVVRARSDAVHATRVMLQAEELREVAGTQGDPLKAVMLMPGVGAIASGLGYPAVRGTQPASTGYFLDGVKLPYLYHLVVGSSVVNPRLVDRIDYSPGAASAEYGRLLGGVVAAKTTEPRDKVAASLSIDLLNAAGFIEMPVASTGTSVLLSGRFSATGLAAGLAAKASSQADNPDIRVSLWDFQARVVQPLGDGQLKLLFLSASDVLRLAPAEVYSFDGELSTSFARLDLAWAAPLASGQLELGLTGGVDDVGAILRVRREKTGELRFTQDSLRLRAGWTGKWDHWTLRAGGDLEPRRASVTVDGSAAGVRDPDERPSGVFWKPRGAGVFGGVFAETTWTPDDVWRVTAGLRADAYWLVGTSPLVVPEPRLTVRRQVSDALVAKAAAALVHQAPTALVSLPTTDLLGLSLGLQEAVQLSSGVEWRLPEGFDFAADVYLNPLVRTVEVGLREIVEGKETDPLRRGELASHGLAFGAELLLRRPLDARWFGWISYGYQHSTRELQYQQFDARGLPTSIATATVPFAFEQRHVATGTLSYRFDSGWTAGATLRVQTGRPEGGVLTSFTRREGTMFDGKPGWVRVDPADVDRLPPLFRLDARVSRRWLFDDWTVTAFVDVFNLSFQREDWFFTYQASEQIFPDGHHAITLEKITKGFTIVLPTIGVEGRY